MGKEKVRNSRSETDYNKKDIILAQNLPKHIRFEHFDIKICILSNKMGKKIDYLGLEKVRNSLRT